MIEEFKNWLDRYGEAWMARDPDAVIKLFSADAAYFEQPFGAPMMGLAAIRRYWTDGVKNGQTDVTFLSVPIDFKEHQGFAQWRATFRRVPTGSSVELDGVLSATFNDQMRCKEFREWWHCRETQRDGN